MPALYLRGYTGNSGKLPRSACCIVRILISAGEASGDRYAAALVRSLSKRIPTAQFFGCAGPALRAVGAEAVIRAEDLAVVGLFEVAAHLPRIHGLFRTLHRTAARRRPDLAILTDAPDFNLRLAAKLKHTGVPVVYYVAPQVWAWRKRRIRAIRRLVDVLLVIFPFEQQYFANRGIDAEFVGHPLCDLAKVRTSRRAFFRRHGFNTAAPLVALLPGSRKGESSRHLPALQDAAQILWDRGLTQVALPASSTTGKTFFEERWRGPRLRVLEGETQDCVGHADVALVASGTATVETALLGTPMATFYKLAWPSYYLARLLVDVPYYSMVNLLVGRPVVPECIQRECSGEKLASEAMRLLKEEDSRCEMIEEFVGLRAALSTPDPASDCAAEAICGRFGPS